MGELAKSFLPNAAGRDCDRHAQPAKRRGYAVDADRSASVRLAPTRCSRRAAPASGAIAEAMFFAGRRVDGESFLAASGHLGRRGPVLAMDQDRVLISRPLEAPPV